MKKVVRSLSLLLVLLTLLGAFATMISCGEDPVDPAPNNPDDPTPDVPNPDTPNTPVPDADGKATYTVSVKTIGGRPVPNLMFHIYKGDNLTSYSQTDANGIGTVKLVPANDYSIELSATSLEGYNVQDRYTFTGASANIVLTSSVIENSSLAGVSYKLGDIIRDFTVMTTDGTAFKLSDAFKNGKKAVLINFWFSTCSPCINEFPYMQSAYEQYKDSIEVIALNNYPTDKDTTIKDFKASMGLTFPVAKDYNGIGNAFGVNAYPTSIMIDRYGTICLIEVGGLTSEKPFVAAFEHFSAANYTQQLFNNIGELTPTEKPTVEMPSSEEIGSFLNGENFTATYAPETESSDAEYSWPFLTGTSSDGKNCVYPANSFKDASFATLHATVELDAGEALAIDWFSDTEIGVDILYILVDGKDIYRISGTSEAWATCYPYVATQAGTYKVSFIYLKDDTTDAETDRVLLSNFRTVAIGEIDAPTYIPREAATNPNANGFGFQNYITPIFSEIDGYYHVGTVDGPILLVNLMGTTQLSGDTSLNDLGYNGKLTDSLGDIYADLVEYCNYAINGTLYGFSPVTAELRTLLERAAKQIGFAPEAERDNLWLQACSYYDAYGTTEQLEDPVKGVAFFAAFETLESTDELVHNTVEYDGRVIMPRGLKYKFIPTRSGAYRIKSYSEEEVNGWIFDDKYEIIHTASIVDRPYGNNVVDTTNVTMLAYLEEGKTYYIDIAYYDIYAAGTFTFTVEYLAETYNHFHLASPAYFTYIESTTGSINETIAGGIDVVLHTDGYYHELRADGSVGSIVYADFTLSTGLFNKSIKAMIEGGGFNFTLTSTDQEVLAKLEELNNDKDACREYYRTLWGESYAEWAEIYHLEAVLAGETHGVGTNLTEAISLYLDDLLTADDAPELEGCVAVDAQLAWLLQQIMDKYTFEGVDHSWTKLCYYYKLLGPANA
ncbi:MAG: redoxin domain-containing protein [Clostridia bacterium]|nr:redoxin domain-containing protein [Clostridia bacterium]